MVDLAKYTHIIWDWNGTLLDDVWLCVEIINRLLAEWDLSPVSMERYRSVFTFPVRHYYEALGFNFSVASWEKVSTAFITIYEQNRRRCLLMQDAKSTLQQISSLGLTQSVLSASKQDYLEKAIEEYALKDLFCALSGLDNHHAAGKEGIGREFIARHGLDGSEILLIGDTLHDAHVAAAIGADCCLISAGHQTTERLVSSSLPVIPSLADLF